ncbi:glycoside hydrolase family 28 protein [Winogradskyella sp.]|uniref:glycoside hydrolase family 28 protein n=1 Tax=Winogradskyella sp. TaxID=1883156 RepID=UPI003BA86C1C
MKKKFLLLSLLVVLLSSCDNKKEAKTSFDITYAKAKIDTAWKVTYPAILKQIVPPTFRADTIVVNDSLRFRENLHIAMKNLSEKGGGVIHIPTGKYPVNGPIVFESNINLNLAEGAVLEFSNEPKDYLPTVKGRWEGTFAMNYSPQLYAYEKENLAITGKGEVDGNCEDTWGQWKSIQKPDKKRIRQMGNDRIPIEERVFGEGHYLRPTGIEFIKCKNILFEDFTIHHTPFWTIHPVLSENITARRLNVQMGVHNDDGFDPEHCKNVLIENSIFSTWDDCISIKAGRDQDGWKYPPSENIIVRNNDFNNIVGSGFCIGSEMAGGVRNVFVHDNTLQGSDKHAFQFKSNPDRGGFIEEVYMKDIKVLKPVAYAFEFTTDYKGWRGNEYFVKYNDFYFQNIEVAKATDISIKINGRPEENVHRVYLENISVKESPAPFIANYTQDLILNNVSINGKQITEAEVTTTIDKANE